MPYFSRNIPFRIFYGSIFLELFRIVSCTLTNNDFLPTTCDLFSGMIAKGGNKAALTKKLKKAIQRSPIFSQKFGKTSEEKNVSIVKNIL